MWFCLGFRVESKSLNIYTTRFLDDDDDDDEIGGLSKGAKKNIIYKHVIYRRRRLYEERREGKRERRRRRPSSSSSPSPSLPLSLFLGGGRFGRRKREREDIDRNFDTSRLEYNLCAERARNALVRERKKERKEGRTTA